MAMPGLEKLSREYKSRGVQFIGMSMDTDTIGDVKPVIKHMGITYTITTGTRTNLAAGRSYNADGLPSVYVIDKNGIVRWSFSGYYDGFDNDLKAEINKLLKQR